MPPISLGNAPPPISEITPNRSQGSAQRPGHLRALLPCFYLPFHGILTPLLGKFCTFTLGVQSMPWGRSKTGGRGSDHRAAGLGGRLGGRRSGSISVFRRRSDCGVWSARGDRGRELAIGGEVEGAGGSDGSAGGRVRRVQCGRMRRADRKRQRGAVQQPMQRVKPPGQVMARRASAQWTAKRRSRPAW